MTKEKDSKRAAVDWDRIEPHWRAGILSVLQIAADYEKATGRKISHTAINKHFKALQIPRNLAEKVRDKAKAIVSAAAVSEQVSAETTARDAEIINANAQLQADVVLSHRRDIKRGRSLTVKLLEELEQQCDNPDLLEKLGDIIIGPPITGDEPADRAAERDRRKLEEAFNKAISLGGRTSTMKQLADSLKVLVALEREAYGIDGEEKQGGRLEDWLDELK